jgi:hypothetical protein
LVRAVTIVNVFPLAKRPVDLGEGGWECDDLVELLTVGAVGTLDVAVQLGGARWQDEEAEAAVPAGCLELGYELGTPVDLDRFDGEGHALKDRIQEAGRRVCGGAAVGLQYLPAAEDIAGGEVFEAEPGEEIDMDSVDLDDEAGCCGQ